MANVIPMAGLGSRFTKPGYTLPKALIPVSGKPMIIRAIRGMPKSDKWIFIVRQEHIDEYKIDALIKDEVPGAIIISVSKTTEGQACTCMLAEPYLEPDEPLFIAACDNTSMYDAEKYASLCNDPGIDSLVWTFTEKESMKIKPQSYGWCKLAEDGKTIKNMSVKVPVSEDPFHDHAVVATFFFKRSKDFADAVNLMIKEDYRINNEFYVDAVPIFLSKLGKKAAIFDVDLWICWGTPEELYDYQKIEYFCMNDFPVSGLSSENMRHLQYWKKYFDTVRSEK